MAQQPSSSSSQPEPPLSNLIRLAPLHITDLPYHPDLPGSGTGTNPHTSTANSQPGTPKPCDLAPDPEYRSQYLSTFLTQLLSDGRAFLSPSTFSRRFKHHSSKKSPPAASPVEVLDWSVPASTLHKVQRSSSAPAQKVSSSTPTSSNAKGAPSIPVSRLTPPSSTLDPEYWVARRSIHRDISSKSTTQPGHASWAEFVFGLRDNHSKNECEFTPGLYDARCVVDWSVGDSESEESREAKAMVMIEGRVDGGVEEEGEGEGRKCKLKYENCSMGIYEMCHAIPPPLRPRCFCVLVVTGSVVKNRNKNKNRTDGVGVGVGSNGEAGKDTDADGDDDDDDCFVAVTVPVDLTTTVSASGVGPGPGASFPPNAFYSSGRNVREGSTPQQRKRVVMGVYAAVEMVTRRRGRRHDAERGGEGTSAGEHGGEGESEGKGDGDGDGQIAWVMATTSDAKGILPGWLQRMSVPAAVAKDVGYFIKWIRGVDDARIKEQIGDRV
ncbi:hypothetical protein ABEF95_003845 [Exophiala dermatitidis]